MKTAAKVQLFFHICKFFFHKSEFFFLAPAAGGGARGRMGAEWSMGWSWGGYAGWRLGGWGGLWGGIFGGVCVGWVALFWCCFGVVLVLFYTHRIFSVYSYYI